MSFGNSETNEELSVQIQQKTDQLNLLAGKIAEAESQLETYRDLSGVNNELQEQIFDEQKELDKLQADLIVIKQAIADLESRKGALEDMLEHTQSNFDLLGQAVVVAQGKLDDLQKKSDELIAMSLSDSKEADTKLVEKNLLISNAEQKLEGAQQGIVTGQKSLDDLNQALVDAVASLGAKGEKLAKLELQITQASSDLSGVQQEIVKANSIKEDLVKQNDLAQQQIATDKQVADSANKSREDVVAQREGAVSLKEKWLEDKAANLMQIKAEVEKYYGKPINIQF